MAESDRSIALVWRKSTFSAGTECVEVAVEGRSVFVRDSKNGSDPPLELSADAWRVFLNGMRAGKP
jgi:hypothetical protein